MNAYHVTTGFMPPYTKIIGQRKKDIGEIEKCCQKNMYNTLCVSMYMCVFA